MDDQILVNSDYLVKLTVIVRGVGDMDWTSKYLSQHCVIVKKYSH